MAVFVTISVIVLHFSICPYASFSWMVSSKCSLFTACVSTLGGGVAIRWGPMSSYTGHSMDVWQAGTLRCVGAFLHVFFLQMQMTAVTHIMMERRAVTLPIIMKWVREEEEDGVTAGTRREHLTQLNKNTTYQCDILSHLMYSYRGVGRWFRMEVCPPTHYIST